MAATTGFDIVKSAVVFSRIPGLKTALINFCPKLIFNEIIPEDETSIKQLYNADIIICDIDLITPHLHLLKNTKWVQSTWAGMDALLSKVDFNKIPLHVPIARFTGKNFGQMMAEYTLSHLVAFERDFYDCYENEKLSKWERGGKIRNFRIISDMTIGILGVGNIGNYVAKFYKFLGAKIWGLVREIPKDQVSFIDEFRTTNNVNELLEACDCIISILPKTKETDRLLNMDNLNNCKNALFINVGRGNVIDENDLIAALNEKWFSGAVLDVFSIEPLPENSPLWKMKQVRITPHVSGVSRPQDIAKVFAENYENWINGLELKNVWNSVKGY